MMEENKNVNLNESVSNSIPEDDDLMEYDAIDSAMADVDIPVEAIDDTALNQGAEFLRKFAESFSESFVLDIPNNDIVNRAISDAKVDAKRKFEAQAAKDDNRKKALAAKLVELQKMQ